MNKFVKTNLFLSFCLTDSVSLGNPEQSTFFLLPLRNAFSSQVTSRVPSSFYPTASHIYLPISAPGSHEASSTGTIVKLSSIAVKRTDSWVCTWVLRPTQAHCYTSLNCTHLGFLICKEGGGFVSTYLMEGSEGSNAFYFTPLSGWKAQKADK